MWKKIKDLFCEYILGKKYFVNYEFERGTDNATITKGYFDRKGKLHIISVEEVDCGARPKLDYFK